MVFSPGKPGGYLPWVCAHQREMLGLLWRAEVQIPRATLAALVPCRAFLKSSAPGEGSPDLSHAEGLASLSLPKHVPSLLDCLAVGQRVCCVGAACLMLWGQGSTAISPQLCSLSRLSVSQRCPWTAVALLAVPRASETCPALSLSMHRGAAALGHGRGTGLAAGRVSVPCSATDSLLSCG